jgi:dihydrofolate reductase
MLLLNFRKKINKIVQYVRAHLIWGYVSLKPLHMRKLFVFNFITLNGFYKGDRDDISWHRHGVEESEYAAQSMKGDGAVLLFGRVTYQQMVGYWPTAEAKKNSPEVASGMNKAEKIVFSNTLKSATWENTKLVKGDIVAEIKKLKQTPGKDLTILGSGSIVSLFAENGLIDQYQIMLDPVAIGAGTPIFHNIEKKLDLKLTGTHTFRSGVVLLNYQSL